MSPVLQDSVVAAYAFAAGFTGPNLPISVAVAIAESGLNPYAVNVNVNHSVDHGLWQINDINHDVLGIGNWRDPATNARMAYMVWRRQGWQAWATYNHNSHAQYMTRAKAACEHLGQLNTYTMYRTLAVNVPFEQGSDVVAVQRLVGAVPIDGIYGPITEGYVKRWQGAHSLVMDGIFGPKSTVAAGWLWKGHQ